jgi:hypothetical protein
VTAQHNVELRPQPFSANLRLAMNSSSSPGLPVQGLSEETRSFDGLIVQMKDQPDGKRSSMPQLRRIPWTSDLSILSAPSLKDWVVAKSDFIENNSVTLSQSDSIFLHMVQVRISAGYCATKLTC